MSGSRVTLRAAAIAAAAIGAGMTLPAACLFPDYTFDLNATGGSGTTSTTTSTSSGSTSTTSSSGGGGTSTSTSSSSGMPCASKDCSDPMCQDSYACVPAVPAGWTGPFALYDGPPASDPGCGGLWPNQAFIGNKGLSSVPATCSDCKCGLPQNQTCVPPATIDVEDSVCGTTSQCGASLPTDWSVPCTTSTNTPGLSGGQTTCGPSATDCNSGAFAPCNISLSAGTTTVTGGSCTATTVVANKPTPTWQSVGEACGDAMPGTGCNGSQVCLPKPPGGFESKVCVMHSGEQPCPPGQFTEQHVFFTGYDDSRACSDCACGSPSGGSCSATITVHSSGTACTGTPIATLNVTSTMGACTALSGNPQVGARKAVTTAPAGGTCTPSGGQASGTVTEDTATAVTFCCVQ